MSDPTSDDEREALKASKSTKTPSEDSRRVASKSTKVRNSNNKRNLRSCARSSSSLLPSATTKKRKSERNIVESSSTVPTQRRAFSQRSSKNNNNKWRRVNNSPKAGAAFQHEEIAINNSPEAAAALQHEEPAQSSAACFRERLNAFREHRQATRTGLSDEVAKVPVDEEINMKQAPPPPPPPEDDSAGKQPSVEDTQLHPQQQNDDGDHDEDEDWNIGGDDDDGDEEEKKKPQVELEKQYLDRQQVQPLDSLQDTVSHGFKVADDEEEEKSRVQLQVQLPDHTLADTPTAAATADSSGFEPADYEDDDDEEEPRVDVYTERAQPKVELEEQCRDQLQGQTPADSPDAVSIDDDVGPRDQLQDKRDSPVEETEGRLQILQRPDGTHANPPPVAAAAAADDGELADREPSVSREDLQKQLQRLGTQLHNLERSLQQQNPKKARGNRAERRQQKAQIQADIVDIKYKLEHDGYSLHSNRKDDVDYIGAAAREVVPVQNPIPCLPGFMVMNHGNTRVHATIGNNCVKDAIIMSTGEHKNYITAERVRAATTTKVLRDLNSTKCGFESELRRLQSRLTSRNTTAIEELKMLEGLQKKTEAALADVQQRINDFNPEDVVVSFKCANPALEHKGGRYRFLNLSKRKQQPVKTFQDVMTYCKEGVYTLVVDLEGIDGHCIVYNASAGAILDGNNKESIRVYENDTDTLFSKNGYIGLKSVYLCMVKKTEIGKVKHYI